MSIPEYILEAGGFNDKTNWGEDWGRPALCRQLQAVMGDILDGRVIETPEEAGEYLARGGQWAIATIDAIKDLREVFGIEGDWEEYCRACGRACGRIYRGAI